MHFRIRWARAIVIASGLALLVASTVPASASAHGIKRAHATTSGDRVTSSTYRAMPQIGQARGRTLIFGGGDLVDASLNIPPTEPITNLQKILTDAGYGVDVSSSLPTNLKQYRAIWFLDTSPLTSTEETQLEAFVSAGRGVFLTGERPCTSCDALDNADGSVINNLVSGGGVQVGGLGDADNETAPNAVTPNAIDRATVNPNVLTTWTPGGPGGMSGVAPANVLTATNFGSQPTPTGALWDESSLIGGHGRLAILMDINWLETETPWDQTTATQMAVNLERFLMSSFPVPVKHSPRWSGYASKANGVRDVSGEWTVPTVDCTKATVGSAVGIWVGIDGFGNNKLVKAGVGVTCASPTATPCYYLFSEVLPGTESPITGCSGVAPGDDISVDVDNSPFGSSSFVVTIKDNGEPFGAPVTVTAPSKRDRSAECVVQMPPGNVGPTPTHFTQLADFGTVSFTACSATALQNAGNNLDTNQLAEGSDGAFTVSALNLGTRTRSRATVSAATLPDPTWTVSWVSAH